MTPDQPKKNPLGATGTTVADNIRRLRTGQNLPYTELAARLDRLGRPIPLLGLRKLETYERRIDADDLVALAAALQVSPATLLTPPTAGPDATVDTAVGPVRAGRWWDWLTADRPLTGETVKDVFDFIWRSVPSWLIGNRIHLDETGLAPNKTYSVRKNEQFIES
jgi:transcriptional regulator with XRE-family HTH domain